MLANDFIYDGEKLSELGYLVCEFDDEKGFKDSAEFTTITMNNASSYFGRKRYKTGLMYENSVELEFCICKDPDIYPPAEKYFNEEEVRYLTRWLNRSEYHQFGLFSLNDTSEIIYFNATFNIKLVKHGAKVAGLKLKMISDSPYGYGESITYEMDFRKSNKFYVSDISDDECLTYPETIIECRQSGTLQLINETTGSITHIKNCTTGEKITFSGFTRIIESTNPDHNLAKDFNYGYPTLGNTFDNRINVITCDFNAKVTMTYTPIIKNIP